MLWNSWAKSWGTAWAESWGPLEEHEQTPHGGGDSSAARLAREAVEKARRKAARKRSEDYAKEAQEALDALDAQRETVAQTEARILPADLPESLPDELPEVEALAKIEPLAPVNDLVYRVLAIADTQPVLLISRETQTNDDDEAMALIMILSELD